MATSKKSSLVSKERNSPVQRESLKSLIQKDASDIIVQASSSKKSSRLRFHHSWSWNLLKLTSFNWKNSFVRRSTKMSQSQRNSCHFTSYTPLMSWTKVWRKKWKRSTSKALTWTNMQQIKRFYLTLIIVPNSRKYTMRANDQMKAYLTVSSDTTDGHSHQWQYRWRIWSK